MSKALHKGKYGGRSRSTIVAAVCAALLGGVIFASSQAYANPISDFINNASSFFSSDAATKSEPDFPNHTIQTVSPNGTTINLFDYWLTTQNANDTTQPRDYKNIGINAGHDLRFLCDSKNESDNANKWTGSSEPYQGIVASTLGTDGYPQRAGGESLAYLFNSSDADDQGGQQGKAAYMNVKGLLQADNRSGYYTFDATKNFASFDAEENNFDVYDTWGVKAGGGKGDYDGQFFPFNSANDVLQDGLGGFTQKNINAASSALHHWFGLSMASRFVQKDGGTNRGQAVTYDFSGDDDAWIFIDGVLVGDLGGIHDACSISINFQTGRVVVYNDANHNGAYDQWQETAYQTTTIKAQFQGAGRDTSGFHGDTFADETYHTLNFYYLERGGVSSNMKLKYNLVTVPESDIVKVDQASVPVADAQFELYPTGEDYMVSGAPAYTGSTDVTGIMRLLDSNGIPVSLDTLKTQSNYWVAREVSTPEGYRNDADIPLYFDPNITSNAMLLSADPWRTGAYAQAKLTATTSDSGVFDTSGNKLSNEDGTVDGILFAVVTQKAPDGSWHPVYGDALSGWTVAEGADVSAAIEAAQRTSNIFTLNANGEYEVELEDMPGQIQSYQWIIDHNDAFSGDASYNVEYYYTTADRLTSANEGNTVQVRSGEDDINRQFATNLYVANVENKLIVQKTDEEGNPVNGATFALYAARDVHNGVVDADATPVAQGVTDTINLTNDTQAPYTLDGAIHFGKSFGTPLEEGEYYLAEVDPPDGYATNTTLTHVIIDATGVYADAGTADDGVVVAKGLGRVLGSMQQFAADDDVDSTLHDIKAALLTTNEYVSGGAGVAWSQPNWDNITGERATAMHMEYNDPGDDLPGTVFDYAPSLEGGPTALVVDEGWSRLQIQQCLDHRQQTEHDSPYQDLGTTELSGSFSGSTTIRVTDRKVSSLEVSKTVGGNVEAAPADASFSFTLALKGADGQSLTGPYDAQVFRGETESGPAFALADGGTFTLKDGETLCVYGLPEGATYTVTETLGDPSSSDDGAAAMPPGFSLSAINNNGTTNGVDLGAGSATGTIGSTAAGNAGASVAFTNTYTPVSLTIAKKVEAASGLTPDSDRAFDFSLTLLGRENSTFTATRVTPGEDGQTEEPVTLEFDNEGKTIFSLKAGQYLRLDNVGTGSAYAVEETTDDGAGFRLSNIEGAGTNDVSSRIGSGTMGTGDVAVTFTNAYAVAPITVQNVSAYLGGTKQITGRDFQDGDSFTFTIEASQQTPGAPLPHDADDADVGSVTVNPTSGSSVGFSLGETITFDAPGSYSYIIREASPQNGGLPGIDYDQAAYRLTIKVVDKGDGTLALAPSTEEAPNPSLMKRVGETVEPAETVVFTNRYDATDAQVVIQGMKTLTGRALVEGEFSFAITPLGYNADGSDSFDQTDPAQPMPEPKTTTNGAEGLVQFGSMTFTGAHLGRTYGYAVSEVVPDDATNPNVNDGATRYVDAAAEQKQMAGWTYKGVTYDASERIVKVSISRSEEGGEHIVAAVSPNGGADTQAVNFSFANEYEATGQIDYTNGFSVDKTLTGRNWAEGEQFGFTFSAVGGRSQAGEDIAPDQVPMPEKTTLYLDDTVRGKFFDGIAYDLDDAGNTYVYKIVENNAGQVIDGVAYSQAVYQAKVSVADNGDGTLAITSQMQRTVADDGQTIDPGQIVEDRTAAFTNTYAAQPTAPVTLEVQKTLTGRAWTDADVFDFRLNFMEGPNDGQSAPGSRFAQVGSPAEGATSRAMFQPITFRVAGDYKYIVYETTRPTGGLTVDGHTATITVHVRDNGKGQLVVDPNQVADSGIEYNNADAWYESDRAVTDAAAFTNVYATGAVDLSTGGLVATKKLDGRAMNQGEFGFVITASAPDGSVSVEEAAAKLGLDAAAGYTVAAPAAADDQTVPASLLPEPTDESGSLATFTQDDIGKTFSYRVSEVQPTENGTFEGDAFEGAQLVGEGADQHWEYKGVSYDSTVYSIDMRPEDGGNGLLKVTVTVVGHNPQGGETSRTDYVYTSDRGDDPTATTSFENSYTLASGEAKIDVQKTLDGRDGLEGESFVFDLTAVTPDAPMPGGSSDAARGGATVTINGTELTDGVSAQASFDAIEFSAPGTYYYEVTEHSGDAKDVTYDNHVANVRVDVSDNGEGALVAAVTYDNSAATTPGDVAAGNAAAFTNVYEAPAPTPGSIDLTGTKHLDGRAFQEGDQFTFHVEAADGAPLPSGLDESGNLTWSPSEDDVAAQANEAAFSFGSITFTEPGAYLYTFTEQQGSAEGMAYDTDPRIVTITVENDGVATISDEDLPKLTWTNVWEQAAEPATFSIEGTKVLAGAEGLDEGRFAFKVEPQDGAPLGENAGIAFNGVGSDEDGDGTFEAPITLLSNVDLPEQGKTYSYLITEVNDGSSDVVFDSTRYMATVSADAEGSASIVYQKSTDGGATWADTDSVRFENRMSDPAVPPAGELDGAKAFAGKKTLVGRSWQAGDAFTFSLAAGDAGTDSAVQSGAIELPETSVTVVAPDSGSSTTASFSFGNVVFHQAGSYTFKIAEDAGDLDHMTYDSHEYVVTVAVTEGDGGLDARVASTTGSSEFVNRYAAPTVYELDGTKELTGRALDAGEFSFTVDALDGAPMPERGTAKNGADGAFSFGTVTFDKPGTYRYVIREDIPEGATAENDYTLDGMTYDASAYTVELTVEDGGSGALEVTEHLIYHGTDTETADVVSAAKFANAYDAGEVTVGGDGEAGIVARKELANRDLEAGEFGFTVTDAAGNAVAHGVNDASGAIEFDPLSYSTAQLNADVSAGIATCVRGESDDVYSYHYTVSEDALAPEDGVSVVKGSFEIVIEITDDRHGALSSTVVYPEDYEDGLVFKNTYGAQASVQVALAGSKRLDVESGNNAPDITGAYTFTLTGIDGAPMPQGAQDSVKKVTNDAAGNVDFGFVDYTMEGMFGSDGSTDGNAAANGELRSKTFTYTVSESGEVAGVINDEVDTHTIEVIVTDNGDGTLSAAKKVDGVAVVAGPDFTFVNTYGVTPTDPAAPTGEGGIKITKTLSGRDLIEDEFSFVMTDAQGNAVSTGVNAADGSVAMDGIVFDAPGTYAYTLSEVTGDAGGVVYDDARYTVVATVSDVGDGTLAVAWKAFDVAGNATEQIVFENEYTTTPAAVSLEATKVLKGRNLTSGEFSFEIRQGESVLQTATNDASGRIAFDPIAIDEPGTYSYDIAEVKGNAEGVVYDEVIHTVTVVVVDDGKGALYVESENYEGGDPVFVNTYTAPVDPGNGNHGGENPGDGSASSGDLHISDIVRTGDGLLLWAILAGVTAVVSAGVIVYVLRRRNSHGKHR